MKTILSFFLAVAAFAALPDNTTTWEVRAGVGAATNGGCYITGSTGTDFTQQNGAQFSGTDLLSVTGSEVFSLTHSFVATDVGNCIQIGVASGWTPGFYYIVSVNAGDAILDANPATGLSTNGVWSEGGAILDPQVASTNATAGNTVWLKGNFVTLSVLTVNKDSRAAQPFSFIGYGTTRGDGTQIALASPSSINLIGSQGTSVNVLIKNIAFSTSNISPLGCASALNTAFLWHFDNVKMSGCSFGIDDNGNNWQPLLVTNSEFTGLSGSAAIKNGASTTIIGSYIHDNTGDGVHMLSNAGTGGNTALEITYSTVVKNGGNGVTVDQGSVNGTWTLPSFKNDTFSFNTGDGVKVNSGGTYAGLLSWNVIYWGNTGAGIENNTGTLSVSDQKNNAFGSNTGGNRINVPAGTGDVTLTGSPFTSVSDFTLNATAGAGAACKGAGFPGITTAGTGHYDIGPLQSAGGAGPTATPIMSGYAQ